MQLKKDFGHDPGTRTDHYSYTLYIDGRVLQANLSFTSDQCPPVVHIERELRSRIMRELDLRIFGD